MPNEPNYRIIAIDPGGTTGWASYSARTLEVPDNDQADSEWHLEYYDESWICGQMGPGDHHQQLYQFLELQQVQNFTVIGERFDFRGNDRPDIDLMAREYMGVVKLFSQDRSVDVVWQWPFEAVGRKSFVQERHLKNIGVWVKGGASQWVHAMDAYRHLLHYMTTKQRRIDILRKMGK